MQSTMREIVKKPAVYRSLYIAVALIAAFFLGVIAEYSIQNRGNDPVVVLPKQPIPLALQYKNGGSQNPADFAPAADPTTPSVASVASGSPEKAFVASKTGTKYYPADCGSVTRIKPENRVYFGSEQDAQDKGYTRSDACK